MNELKQPSSEVNKICDNTELDKSMSDGHVACCKPDCHTTISMTPYKEGEQESNMVKENIFFQSLGTREPADEAALLHCF